MIFSLSSELTRGFVLQATPRHRMPEVPDVESELRHMSEVSALMDGLVKHGDGDLLALGVTERAVKGALVLLHTGLLDPFIFALGHDQTPAAARSCA